MPVTVQQALWLEAFTEADAQLVAGGRGLPRTVRWSHVAETLDIAKYLSGGELLLTTGLQLNRADTELRHFLRQLDRVGAAGLAVELGWGLDALPTALVAEADRIGFPLLQLPHGTQFVKLTEQLDRAVLADQHQRLAKAERIGRTFTDLAASGAAPREIVDRLGRLVNRPVAMLDELDHPVDFSEPDELGEQEADELSRHPSHDRGRGRGPGPHVDEFGMPGSTERGQCLWTPLVLLGVPYGSVHVVASATPFDEIDFVALDRAAAALSIALLLRQRQQRLSAHAQRSLVADLVAGRQGSHQEFARRTRALGANMAGRKLAAVVVVPVHRPGSVEQPPDWQMVVECLTAAADAHGCTVLCGGQDRTTIALLGLPAADELDAVATDAARRLQLRYPPGAVVGTCLADLATLTQAFDNATRVNSYGMRHGRGVYPAERLRLQLLFQRLHDNSDLAQFVRDEIGPLIEHDAAGGAALLPTLRVYLACGGAKTEAASRLHIVRRTLYRRLAEIERVLGRPLDDGEAAMRLSLAIWAWDTTGAK